MKPWKWEQVMGLSSERIAETFPHGARSVGKDGWQPADEGGAVKTLDQLLKAKEERLERPRYLRQSYSIPRKYLDSRGKQKKPQHDENENYTYLPSKAVRGQQGPEMVVPEEFQKRLTAEAHLRDAERNPPLSERLKRLETHAEPHQLESLKRRIEGLERSLHDKAA